MPEMDAFSRFHELPLHIRQAIWKHAASVPRVVGICENPKARPELGQVDSFEMYCPTYPEKLREYGYGREAVIVSGTRPPAILHVCRESRTTELAIYKPLDQNLRNNFVETSIDQYTPIPTSTSYTGMGRVV